MEILLWDLQNHNKSKPWPSYFEISFGYSPVKHLCNRKSQHHRVFGLVCLSFEWKTNQHAKFHLNTEQLVWFSVDEEMETKWKWFCWNWELEMFLLLFFNIWKSCASEETCIFAKMLSLAYWSQQDYIWEYAKTHTNKMWLQQSYISIYHIFYIQLNS